MRVVGGIAGGLRLQAPPGKGTRPTSDRAREAVFNMLGSRLDLDGAAVVDLFAGSGALGIEALSRGAASATFVETDPAAIRVIEANLASTGLAGGTVVRGDAMRFLEGGGRRFAVAFVDPPYAFDGWPRLIELLAAEVAVLESDRPIELPDTYRVLSQKRYGGTVVTLASPTGKAAE